MDCLNGAHRDGYYLLFSLPVRIPPLFGLLRNGRLEDIVEGILGLADAGLVH